MHPELRVILVFLAAILGLAKYIEGNFVRDSTRVAVKKSLKEWHGRANNPSMVKLLQNNFLLLSHILDKAYGSEIVSRKLIRYTANLTAFYLFLTMICTVLMPNSFLAMEPNPSQVFQVASMSVPTVIQDYEKTKIKLKPEEEKIYLAILLALQKDDTFINRGIFTFLCFSGFWILATFLNILSMIVCRYLLKELATTEGISIMITSLLFDILIISGLYAFGIVIICSILFPPLGALIGATLYLAFHWSSYLGLWLAFTYAFTACALSPNWMKALVLFSLLPLIAIATCLFLTIVTRPYKDQIYNLINQSCLYVIEHKHGPLAFIFSTLSLVIGGVSGLAELLSWY